ncbi:hypothetical protein [Nocardioides sp. 503]|uniref:hypothetical protein n=1 Tax=Nocardioides sp. 503 TaxID=2508326 RepID=UPI00106FA483|nr:hypothetical protein [Nocardioides sp. 503]
MMSRRRIPALVALVVVALLVVVAWRWWYLDDGRRADWARDDLADLPGVHGVVDRDGVPEVELSRDVGTEEIADVLDEAADYSELVEQAGGGAFVTVRGGQAVVRVGDGQTRVEPDALDEVGDWPRVLEDVEVLITAGDDGLRLSATSRWTPSVRTLHWMADGLSASDSATADSVRELSATKDEGTPSRVLSPPDRSITESSPVLGGLAALGDLNPVIVMSVPHDGVVSVRTGPDEIDRARRRVTSATSPYPDLAVDVTTG